MTDDFTATLPRKRMGAVVDAIGVEQAGEVGAGLGDGVAALEAGRAVPGAGAVAQVEVTGAGEELGKGRPQRAAPAGRSAVPARGELAAQIE